MPADGGGIPWPPSAGTMALIRAKNNASSRLKLPSAPRRSSRSVRRRREPYRRWHRRQCPIHSCGASERYQINREGRIHAQRECHSFFSTGYAETEAVRRERTLPTPDAEREPAVTFQVPLPAEGAGQQREMHLARGLPRGVVGAGA